jgi:transmembrane sensor
VAGGVFLIAELKPPASPSVGTLAWRDYATPIGKRADATLSDSSVLHLDADSKVRVAFSKTARELRLERGQAMFEVAHEPARPFDVSAGGATVTAVGTIFDVDLVGKAVEVRVFRGAVKVASPDGGVRLLRAGEWLTLADGRGVLAGRFQPDMAQTWRANWLQADRMPLGDVVARLNRYSNRAIVLKSRDLERVPISGRFDLSRTDSALAMLTTLLDLDVARGPQEISLTRRGGKPGR